jgi:hypothetical protein
MMAVKKHTAGSALSSRKHIARLAVLQEDEDFKEFEVDSRESHFDLG